MNLWIRLPEPLDASDLAARAARENVSYLPGRYFIVSRPQTQSLRLSFAGLEPEKIRHGMQVLGSVFRSGSWNVPGARIAMSPLRQWCK